MLEAVVASSKLESTAHISTLTRNPRTPPIKKCEQYFNSVTNWYLLFIHYREQHKVSTRLRKRVIYRQQQQ